MKDNKIKKGLENLSESAKVMEMGYYEVTLLKCLNNINDNLDDIRIILRDLKNHFTLKGEN